MGPHCLSFARACGLIAACALLGLAPPPLLHADAEPVTERSTPFEGRLVSCEWPGIEGAVYCGRFDVPENRAEPEGRRIQLRLAALPATGERAASDAITFLAGGGVTPATRLAPFLARALSHARRSRDLVLVDQRGTGESHPLHCPETPDAATPPSSERCLEAIEATADPRFYTTPHAMDDLDAIRRWLGYDQWTIWGASYGTKAARVYLRRYPGRVRALVLHGVVPLESSMWPQLFVSGQEMLDRVLGDCARDTDCASRYPATQRSLAEIRARVRRDPLRVALPSGPMGEPPQEVVLDEASLGQALYGALRTARAARDLPGMIHEAANGDPAPLAEGLRSPAGPPLVPRGVYLSIACSEEMVRLPGAKAEGPTTLDDGTWLAEEAAACEGWPVGDLPEGFWREVVDSRVPALVMSGELDAITPPRYGARIAAGLAQGRHLILPDRSHDDVDPCVGGVVDRFLDTADPWGVDVGCLGEEAPPAASVNGGGSAGGPARSAGFVVDGASTAVGARQPPSASAVGGGS
jgi:pimeloyl-ACP methyl ester carboxylesterase